MNENMFIDGLVTVKQDDKIILNSVHNKFVEQGLYGILSILNIAGSGAGDCTFHLPNVDGVKIYLGTSDNTSTSNGMTALSSPIGTAPGTAASFYHTSVTDGSTTGIWEVTYTNLWSAGTVSGTVGEMALYGRVFKYSPNIYFGFICNDNNKMVEYGNTVRSMISRLAVADGEFEAFTIDNSKPLTVDWKIRFAFS